MPDASAPTGEPRLAIGIAATREFLPEEIGRSAQIDETARAVAAAVRYAGIADASDVHFVQIKCPYHSMAYSRGVSALGVALALGEVKGPISQDAVLKSVGPRIGHRIDAGRNRVVTQR